jgi:hypothetical protein
MYAFGFFLQLLLIASIYLLNSELTILMPHVQDDSRRDKPSRGGRYTV